VAIRGLRFTTLLLFRSSIRWPTIQAGPPPRHPLGQLRLSSVSALPSPFAAPPSRASFRPFFSCARPPDLSEASRVTTSSSTSPAAASSSRATGVAHWPGINIAASLDNDDAPIPPRTCSPSKRSVSSSCSRDAPPPRKPNPARPSRSLSPSSRAEAPAPVQARGQSRAWPRRSAHVHLGAELRLEVIADGLRRRREPLHRSFRFRNGSRGSSSCGQIRDGSWGAEWGGSCGRVS
jgi:hypothetical protein